MQQGNVFDYYKLPKVLSNEETLLYFKEYKSGDKSAREKLILHNIRLVFDYVNSFDSKYDKNELIELGLLGLVSAVDSYDYTKGFKFSSYAISCIKNEILSFIRSDSKFNKENSYDKTIIQKLDEEEEIYYKNTLALAKNNCDIEEFILKKEENKIIRKIVNSLPSRDKEFISLYCGFYDGISYTNQQIADIYNMTVSGASLRIRMIEAIIYKELLKQGLYEHQPNSKRIKQNIVSKYQELVPKGRRRKTIYDYFPGYTKEQVNSIINKLSYVDQQYIYLRNGEYLETPKPKKEWKQEYNNTYYGSIIPKILKLLKKQYGISEEYKMIKSRAKIKKDN